MKRNFIIKETARLELMQRASWLIWLILQARQRNSNFTSRYTGRLQPRSRCTLRDHVTLVAVTHSAARICNQQKIEMEGVLACTGSC